MIYVDNKKKSIENNYFDDQYLTMSLKRRASTRSSFRKPVSKAKPDPIIEKIEPLTLDCTLSDVTCPICLDICIEPVTMPCSHELCLPCFKSMTDLTNFLCPMCRQRISTWYRNAANSNTLVNQDRWKFIQNHFSKEIKNRIEGKTAQIIAKEIEDQKKGIGTSSESKHPCSKPGEIRKEYQEYLRREQERIRVDKENEEKQSLELIHKLIQEEERLSLNDYINILNNNNHNTPVPPRSNLDQPFRPLTYTNTLNRQINNLNNHLIHRVNSMESNTTPIVSPVPVANQNNEIPSNRGRGRYKRKQRNSTRSSNQSIDSEINSRATRPRQDEVTSSETSNSSLRHSDISSLNDTNEASSSIGEENASLIRRLRPRRARD